jgi:hypothetical protein
METSEEQVNINATDLVTGVRDTSTDSHKPGLRALLSIKGFSVTLDNDYSELLQIERELDEIYNNGLLIIKANTSSEETEKWKAVMAEFNDAVKGIHEILTVSKEKIVQKQNTGHPDRWKELAGHLDGIKEYSINAAISGRKLLSEAVHPQWEKEFVNLETPLVESLILHVDSCRVLMQMIESYTPDELISITRMIAEHIPTGFTDAEAVDYQNEYYKALVNFKNEFKKEKNLWDRFLDILAGGTHQSISERIMMERWVNGEEVNL